MENKQNKRMLYDIIEMYLNNKIDEDTFCDEFYYCYDQELNKKTLTTREKAIFAGLDRVVSRYSGFEEDHRLLPGVYTTTEKLKAKISWAAEKLGITSPLKQVTITEGTRMQKRLPVLNPTNKMDDNLYELIPFYIYSLERDIISYREIIRWADKELLNNTPTGFLIDVSLSKDKEELLGILKEEAFKNNLTDCRVNSKLILSQVRKRF